MTLPGYLTKTPVVLVFLSLSNLIFKVKTGVARLVDDIMGDSSAPEGVPALVWGKRKEKDALLAFEKLEKCKHKGFQITRYILRIL